MWAWEGGTLEVTVTGSSGFRAALRAGQAGKRLGSGAHLPEFKCWVPWAGGFLSAGLRLPICELGPVSCEGREGWGAEGGEQSLACTALRGHRRLYFQDPAGHRLWVNRPGASGALCCQAVGPGRGGALPAPRFSLALTQGSSWPHPRRSRPRMKRGALGRVLRRGASTQ